MATTPEGIMALNQPQGAAGAQPAVPQLTRDDFYDITRQSLQTARPDLDMEMEEQLQAFRQLADTLPEDVLRIFSNIFQSILDNPNDYKEALQALYEVAPELAALLPKEFDEEFYASLAFIFQDALRSRRAPGTASVEGIEAMVPQRFAKGGIAEAARLVASQGRGGDTMLAHINPREAQLLKAFGGSGTINPKTGQPEFIFGWIKDNIIDPVIGAGKAVVKAATGVVKGAVKLIKENPIARVVATAALAWAIGPSAFALVGSKAAAAAIASGGISAITGGSLKDIALSSLTAYMGAPGGPIETIVGKYSPAFMNNPLVNAAVAGTIAGTGSGLLQGKSLSESVRSGLTEGAVSAGVTIAANGGVSNAMKNASNATLAKTIDDAVPANPVDTPDLPKLKTEALQLAENNLQSIEAAPYAPPKPLAEVVGQGSEDAIARAVAQSQGSVAPGTTATVPMDSGIARLTAEELAPVSSAYTGAGARSTPTLSGTLPPPGISATYDISPALAGTDEAKRAAVSGLSLGDTLYGDISPMGVDVPAGGIANVPVAGYTPGGPDILPSLKKSVTPGTITEGLGDLFFPSAPTTEQVLDSVQYKNLVAKGLSPDAALKAATAELSPGMLRTYGPAAAAGITALGMAGGFSPRPPQLSPEQQQFAEQMRAPIDLSGNPSAYYVQGLPGVEYGARGEIVGSSPWSAPQTMEDVRVAGRSYAGYDPYSAYALAANPYRPEFMNAGGIAGLRAGGYPRRTGQISGPGTETSDSIPAMLSDGEFVMTARAVRGMGNGSRREGAKKMYALMHKLEKNAARG